MITAQRVVTRRMVARMLEHAIIAWFFVMVEDDLLI
jgi:hypothetical protein